MRKISVVLKNGNVRDITSEFWYTYEQRDISFYQLCETIKCMDENIVDFRFEN